MLWSVPLVPLLVAPLLYLGGRRLGPAGLSLVAGLALLAALALAGEAIGAEWSGSYRWSETLILTLERSFAGMVFSLLVPMVALPVLVYAAYHEAEGLGRLLALLLAFVGAMLLLVLAGDLLTLLIAWELVGACSWALIAHRWDEKGIPGQAGQAFLMTRLGDLGLYLAAAAMYAGTGSFGYDDLAGLEGPLEHVAVAGIVLAAAAKSAQLPFSAWLFAAMAGPVPASALLHSATMVAAGTFLLARLEPQLSQVAWFAPLIVGLGLATALAGGAVAIFQGHAKRLLAASTSAQYGLMWVAVGTGFPGVALLHAVAHACLKAGLFLATGLAERQGGSYSLRDMCLGRHLPGVALLTLILSLALAGVAPLGAAWSKEQIASAAAEASGWLALTVALAGGLSALYSMRFQTLVFGLARKRDTPGRRPLWGETTALAVFALATLVLSVVWWPPLQARVVESFGVLLPESHTWLLTVSLVLVGLGILAGVVVARRESSRHASRHDAAAWKPLWQDRVAHWFGLPSLTLAVTLGTQGVALRLARFDDAVIDASFTRLARGLRRGALGLANGDDRVVDAGLHATARCGQWLAALYAKRGEWLSEGLPEGLARLTDWSARWARQAQTGQMHHYYTGIVAGLALFFVILLLGAYL